MEYSPASKLQVNINDFSSLLWMLKSARQSGGVHIELQAADEERVEVPWRAYLVLVDGEVTACYLYRKVDGRRVLADQNVMLWLHNLGQRELLWCLESSTPRLQSFSGCYTPADLLSSPSTLAKEQRVVHATTQSLPDPPLQASSRTSANSLSAPRLLPSPRSSSRSGTGPFSEVSLLTEDPQGQVGLRTATNTSSTLHLSPSPQSSPHLTSDPLSDPGFPINYQTGPYTTTNFRSEQHPIVSQQTLLQRPVQLESGSFPPFNQQVPSVLSQVPYRIAPTDQGTDTWSRRHRQVFFLMDGTKSVAQIVDILGLSPAIVEQIVADLLAWGVILCI